MMAVQISYEAGDLVPVKPVKLFEGGYLRAQPYRSYDVTPDGQRFLMIPLSEDAESRPIREKYLGNKINLVSNWFDELKRLVPTD